MTTVLERAAPYVSLREGEEAASPLPLRTAFHLTGTPRLGYWDEQPEDRDTHNVLWTRVSQSLGPDGWPVGAPQGSMIHPLRQRDAMRNLRCQECREAARTDEGLVFPVSKQHVAADASSAAIHTDQPPVCRQHAHAAARRSPELAEHGYVFVLAQRARMYGVIGTPYFEAADGAFQAYEGVSTPIPYGHPELRWVVASRLVRTLLSVSVIDLAEVASTP
ncbi:hypothetical protein AB0N81_11110 [Streptomyces sp. NPDC093510]|uniref:hypothetical protein n=1 Tax=Streptomyces sp. NPDC093510 TaxID=3155199 RepID=UPI00342F5110